jgi:hypothetical protein
MESKLIKTTDNFIFLDVTEKAKEVYNSGLFELYAIENNEVETVLLSIVDVNHALEKGHLIGIEVGFIN